MAAKLTEKASQANKILSCKGIKKTFCFFLPTFLPTSSSYIVRMQKNKEEYYKTKCAVIITAHSNDT
jgi:hypothetical protein